MWEPDDRAKVLAYEREMATVCQSCGTRQEDWFITHEDGSWEPRVPPLWRAEDYHCAGCRVTNERRRAMPADAHDKGTTVRLVPAVPQAPPRPVG